MFDGFWTSLGEHGPSWIIAGAALMFTFWLVQFIVKQANARAKKAEAALAGEMGAKEKRNAALHADLAQSRADFLAHLQSRQDDDQERQEAEIASRLKLAESLDDLTSLTRQSTVLIAAVPEQMEGLQNRTILGIAELAEQVRAEGDCTRTSVQSGFTTLRELLTGKIDRLSEETESFHERITQRLDALNHTGERANIQSTAS